MSHPDKPYRSEEISPGVRSETLIKELSIRPTNKRTQFLDYRNPRILDKKIDIQYKPWWMLNWAKRNCILSEGKNSISWKSFNLHKAPALMNDQLDERGSILSCCGPTLRPRRFCHRSYIDWSALVASQWLSWSVLLSCWSQECILMLVIVLGSTIVLAHLIRLSSNLIWSDLVRPIKTSQ